MIDHIKAGTAIGLMDLLGIKDNRTASVALIQNARSRKSASGRKDIIKVEGDASWLNLSGAKAFSQALQEDLAALIS